MIKLTGIKSSTQESQVQEIYNEAFKKAFNLSIIERKHQCDGYFKLDADSNNREISVLIEYKYDIQMKDKIQRARVIAQCLAYLKIFEQHSEAIPKLIFIGDVNECMFIHTNDVIKLLDLDDVNWELPPSSIGQDNNLVLAIVNTINPWIYDVDDKFDFTEVINKIVNSCNNIQSKLHITEKNIEKVYNLFCDRVIKDKKKVQANDLVGAFIGTMLDSEHYYQHPRKKNILVANDKQIAINGDQFELFMSMHNTEYSPKEKRIFTSISDRLIEDTNRRNKGEFYTPTLFVDYAHGMIEKELGVHWKENYTVWDCCCGTKNLTRDYKFKDLYCSTLEQAELDISKNYNKEARSFQFDFLNDPLDDLKVKAPGLLEAFELNKPICFFINPPYRVANGNNGNKDINNTAVCNEMKLAKIGRCSQELHAQFIYRIISLKERFNLTNCAIALYCRPVFITKTSFSNLKLKLFNNFCFLNGCLFNSSLFGGCGEWALSFNIWKTGVTQNIAYFNHTIIDVNKDGSLVEAGNKEIVNYDNLITLGQYKKLDDKRDIEFPNYRELLKPDNNSSLKISNNSLGVYFCGTNLYHMATMPYWHGHDDIVTKTNYTKVVLFDAINELKSCRWFDFWDTPTLPDVINNDFINNCVVLSGFNGNYYDWSLRDIDYHNKLWNIKNEFFWMSKQEILNLAEEHNNDYTYEDALNSDERFVYNKLQEIKDDLSPEARVVLDKATELVKESFKYRELFNESHPEYQVNNWDCGWYQIKALLKEFMPNELKEFRQLYKQLADKMRPMVYELGFLRK